MILGKISVEFMDTEYPKEGEIVYLEPYMNSKTFYKVLEPYNCIITSNEFERICPTKLHRILWGK